MAHSGSDFVERYGPWAVIAGASDGTGAAFARSVAARGVHVVLLSRRQALLDELAADIEHTTGVSARPFALDLAEPDAFTRVVEVTDGLEVGLVMYNAGADAINETFLSYDVEPALRMIHRNCVVPVQMCHHLDRKSVV